MDSPLENVSIGIGTMFWGDTLVDSLFGEIPTSEELDRIVEVAFDNGITLFDTAEGYGGGSSETRLAQALRKKQDGGVVMTKFLPTLWRWSEWFFLRSLHGSASRLHVDVIDIYYIHTPMHPLFHFWVHCACRAQRRHLIRHVALSNCSAQQVQQAVDIASKQYGVRIVAHQLLFSMLSYRSESVQQVIRVCQKHQIRIVAYSVLGQGLLTDREVTEENYRQIRVTRMTGVQWKNELEPLRRTIRNVADAHGATMAQVSLRWAIQKGAIPLVGVKRVSHLQDAIVASKTLQLTDEQMRQLDDACLGKATMEKPLWRRYLFVVLISILILTYRLTQWIPYRKKQTKKNQ